MNAFESRYRQIAQQGRSAWFGEPYYVELIDFWRSWLARVGVSSGRVLEIGCGVGCLASALVEDGFEVVGIDVSATAVQAAQALGVSATFLAADIQDGLPCESSSFDLVLDSDCLHHLAGGGRARFFSESARVLKPGGLLLVKTNIGEPDPALWERFGYDPATRTTSIGGQVANYFADRDEVLGELFQAGYSVESADERPAGVETSAQLYVECRKP